MWKKILRAIKNQLSCFFDFDKTAVLVNNYDWFKSYSFINFIRDIGKKFTISEMVAKEAVKAGWKREFLSPNSVTP